MVGIDQNAGQKRRRRQDCCSTTGNHSAYIAEIPEDVLVEILVRLPLLSIIRCKCVSKAWNRLISDKSFPVTRVSNLAITHLLVCRCEEKPIHSPEFEDFFAINVDDTIDEDDNHPPPSTTLLAMPFLPWQGGLRNTTLTMLDSRNGLILGRINRPSSSLLLLNPSNQTRLPLPSPPSSSTRHSHRMALAFDPKISNHFKVVYVIPYDNHLRVVTFSSESGAWTTSTKVSSQHHGFDPKSMQSRCPSLFADGVLYFTALRQVIRLDIDSETIELIHLPSLRLLVDWSYLGIWNGELRLCEFSCVKQWMQVWKLDQDPSTDRWTLKHSLSFQSLFGGLNLSSPPFTYHIEACFRPDHKDAIFLRIGKNNVVYYEFDTARRKVFILDEDFQWSHMLLPLSPCLLNLFEVKQDMEGVVAKKELEIEANSVRQFESI